MSDRETSPFFHALKSAFGSMLGKLLAIALVGAVAAGALSIWAGIPFGLSFVLLVLALLALWAAAAFLDW